MAKPEKTVEPKPRWMRVCQCDRPITDREDARKSGIAVYCCKCGKGLS